MALLEAILRKDTSTTDAFLQSLADQHGMEDGQKALRETLNEVIQPQRKDLPAFLSPLRAAMFAGDVDVALSLVHLGADVNTMLPDGWIAVHHVAQTAPFQSRLAEVMVKNGANLQARNKFGQTPLHLCRDPEACKFLVKHGADLEALDAERSTPLLSVARGNFVEAAATLASLGANLNHINKSNRNWRSFAQMNRWSPASIRRVLEAAAAPSKAVAGGVMPTTASIDRVATASPTSAKTGDSQAASQNDQTLKTRPRSPHRFSQFSPSMNKLATALGFRKRRHNSDDHDEPPAKRANVISERVEEVITHAEELRQELSECIRSIESLKTDLASASISSVDSLVSAESSIDGKLKRLLELKTLRSKLSRDLRRRLLDLEEARDDASTDPEQASAISEIITKHQSFLDASPTAPTPKREAKAPANVVRVPVVDLSATPTSHTSTGDVGLSLASSSRLPSGTFGGVVTASGAIPSAEPATVSSASSGPPSVTASLQQRNMSATAAHYSSDGRMRSSSSSGVKMSTDPTSIAAAASKPASLPSPVSRQSSSSSSQLRAAPAQRQQQPQPQHNKMALPPVTRSSQPKQVPSQQQHQGKASPAPQKEVAQQKKSNSSPYAQAARQQARMQQLAAQKAQMQQLVAKKAQMLQQQQQKQKSMAEAAVTRSAASKPAGPRFNVSSSNPQPGVGERLYSGSAIQSTKTRQRTPSSERTMDDSDLSSDNDLDRLDDRKDSSCIVS